MVARDAEKEGEPKRKVGVKKRREIVRETGFVFMCGRFTLYY